MLDLNRILHDKSRDGLEKKRIKWVDATRAFAIFCIVLGHAINGKNMIWHIVYGFHVPLFIILGGFTYSCREKEFGVYSIKKFRSIMIPYYFWGIFSIAIYFLMSKVIHEDTLSISQCIVGLVVGTAKNGYMHWNTPMWYLPMYFLIQIVSYVLYKHKPDGRTKCVYGILSFVFAYLLYLIKPDLQLPLGLSSSIYLYPFFVFGSILKDILDYLNELTKLKKLILACTLIAISGFLIAWQKNIDYVTDVYRNYPIFVFSAIAMSLGFIIIIREMPRYNSLVTIVGTNTLGIMILQKFPLYFFIHVCPGVKEVYYSYPLLVSMVVSLITVFCCVVVCIIGTSYAPWAFGRVVLRKRNKVNGGS